MKTHQQRHRVRVLSPWNVGYTLVVVEDMAGYTSPSVTWELPTQAIPPHLRRIGARFTVTADLVVPEADDDIEDVREAVRKAFHVEELSSLDEHDGE